MMIKKFNFFEKNVCNGIYENTVCEKCKNPLDLRFCSEGSIDCSSCGQKNILKTSKQESKNEQ